MRFLTVADRELRSAARQKATYRTRWLTATIFFGLLLWLMWVFGGFTNQRASVEVFQVFSVLTLLYCVFLGTARTADCISGERREGTLGLLFLTNLNSAEIIGGKLCSTALASVYGFMAIFPMLALPLLMGGITFGFFAKTVVGLLNGILFSLSAGFLASVICKRQYVAIATALGAAIAFGGGSLLVAAAADSYPPTKFFAEWIAICSPLYALVAADGTRPFGPNHFWLSAAIVAGMSFSGLCLATVLLAFSWRDRVRSFAKPTLAFWNKADRQVSRSSVSLRRRLLSINPFFWLSARQRVSAPAFMCAVVGITLVTEYVAAPFFGRAMGGGGNASLVLGHLFSWLWAGLGIHALALYYAAMTASQRLAEDKQAGALELILCTPITEREISRGLWLGFWRKMTAPALIAIAAHIFFLWQVMVMATLDPPGQGQLPPGITPWQLFWASLLDKPLQGYALDWVFGFLIRIALLTLVIFALCWPTLGWVGRWLGLRMKHPGFAPVASLALLGAPPVLFFSLLCFVADEINLDQMPERRFLPLMMWLGFGIGVAHCLGLSIWASTRMRRYLRSITMSRYQPLPLWRWQLPSWRLVRRVAFAVTIIAVAISAIIGGYFQYQNWRSTNAWRTFESALKQRGRTLDLAQLMPKPVPDDSNFAKSAAFTNFLHGHSQKVSSVFEQWASLQPPGNFQQGNVPLMDWALHKSTPLERFAVRASIESKPSSSEDRRAHAEAFLKALQPHSKLMLDLSSAAAQRPCFQISTQCTTTAIFHPDTRHTYAIDRLHLVYQIRACASVQLGKNTEALEDVLTGIRLLKLSRQVPDNRATLRSQAMLARSLQPLWEGLSQRAWSASEIASIQEELQKLDFLADYTNAVRRTVLAHIDIWRKIPDNPTGRLSLPVTDAGYMQASGWELQPRAWWFENCLQLHAAGEHAVAQIDSETGRIYSKPNWSLLNGLPLDSVSRELLQQGWWSGANPGSISFIQTSLNQAILACALERFRLNHAIYPQTLDELVPCLLASIPRDPISGRHMIYQQFSGTNFCLRGVGPNALDDRRSKTSDDWLWAYSTNTLSNARKPISNR